MAKLMALIEKQNRRMMRLLSQLLGRQQASSSIETDAASPFVGKISKASLPKKLNLPILTATYDGLTDPIEYVTQYKHIMW